MYQAISCPALHVCNFICFSAGRKISTLVSILKTFQMKSQEVQAIQACRSTKQWAPSKTLEKELKRRIWELSSSFDVIIVTINTPPHTVYFPMKTPLNVRLLCALSWNYMLPTSPQTFYCSLGGQPTAAQGFEKKP